MKYTEAFFQDHIEHVMGDTHIGIGKKISGKVRDSYLLDDYRLLIATDRLSAFDVILTQIPFKGEILTRLSLFWFDKTKDIIPNHVVKVLSGNAIMVRNCRVIPLEVIVRGYLTGSLWRSYQAGEKVPDMDLQDGLPEYYRFPEPIVCFTTKAEQGVHDEPLSREDILRRGIVSESELDKISKSALSLYQRGNEVVHPNNLILVDTKYEFGRLNDEILLVDEIHTQDSSRYWIKDVFEKKNEVTPLDKEYFRGWLLSKGYKGDGAPPEIPNYLKIELVMRYLEAYRKITGCDPELTTHPGNYEETIKKQVEEFMKNK